MGLLAKMLRRPNAQVATAPAYKTFTEYAPVFSSHSGSLYEQALTRSAVERIARACSKLKPEVLGTARPRVQRAIHNMPNAYMTWPQMLYRTATILEADTTAFVVPSYDQDMNVTGVWPLKADFAEVVEYGGEPWVRFYFASGDTAAIELSNVCVLTKFQYGSDFFGSGNAALDPTLDLLDAQVQAQKVSIKNGATIRYIGQVGSMVRPEDVEAKRTKFSEDNLSERNQSGLLIYDETFNSVTPVTQQGYTISSEEMERINRSVYTYFGVSESILTNDYSEEQWGAFYEGAIEPFAVQLGEGLSRMLYSPRELSTGNRITFSANRLEYASNASKRNMIRDMLDRRIMTINEAREVLQLPPVPGGDSFVYRGEYVSMSMDGKVTYKSGGDSGDGGANTQQEYKDFDLGGDDQVYNDTDARGKGDSEPEN